MRFGVAGLKIMTHEPRWRTLIDRTSFYIQPHLLIVGLLPRLPRPNLAARKHHRHAHRTNFTFWKGAIYFGQDDTHRKRNALPSLWNHVPAKCSQSEDVGSTVVHAQFSQIDISVLSILYSLTERTIICALVASPELCYLETPSHTCYSCILRC